MYPRDSQLKGVALATLSILTLGLALLFYDHPGVYYKDSNLKLSIINRIRLNNILKGMVEKNDTFLLQYAADALLNDAIRELESGTESTGPK